MTHIYNQALWIIGWLGEKESATEEGLKPMKRLQDTFDLRVWKDSDTKSEKREYWDVNIEDLLAHGLPDTIEPAWDSLVSLWELKWFSRIWIVQEIQSTQDFMFLYGDEYLSGIDLLRVGLMFFNNPVFNSIFAGRFKPSKPSSQTVSRLAGLKEMGPDLGLIHLLWMTQFFEASDPRDKIFALVNLTNNINSDFINYSLDAREVLINTARAVFYHGTSDILSLAQCRDETYNVPSWVPDWTTTHYRYEPLIYRLAKLERWGPGSELQLESEEVSRGA
jgi:hypothetical protein